MRLKNGRNITVGFIALGLAFSCAQNPTLSEKEASPSAAEPSSRRVAALFGGKNGRLESGPVTFLDQNWNQEDRETFYFTPQGSHVIPVRFAQELKAESGKLFFSSEQLKKYGYIPQKADPDTNPMGLPVGFTIDGFMGYGGLVKNPREVGERWVGINCAACHTSNLQYKGNTIRIDGGQSLSDFQRFMTDMDRAVFSVAENPTSLQQFVAAVAKKMSPPADPAQIAQDYKKFVAERKTWQRFNHSNHVYGGGRNDAFGVIFNQVLARDLGIPANAREPDAPVSYPVIWDAPQHDWVQWNGLASNDPNIGGAMSRNLGQVLGVFGSMDFSEQTEQLGGYCSSARRTGLDTLEKKVTKLWSPKWPAKLLGKIESDRADLGSRIYKKNCVSCHALIQHDDPNRVIKAKLVNMAEVGTDARMNLNAGNRTALTGSLIGRRTRLQVGRPLEREEPAVYVLKHAVASALAGSISPNTCVDSIEIENLSLAYRWSRVARKAIFETPMPAGDDLQTKKERESALLAALSRYKARPLNGVWASAPFLHNGSVRSLYQLLLPPRERERQFSMGCEEFDPSEVGFNCDKGNDPRATSIDLSIEGNRNTGHEYGTELSHEDRMNLIEYIKTL